MLTETAIGRRIHGIVAPLYTIKVPARQHRGSVSASWHSYRAGAAGSQRRIGQGKQGNGSRSIFEHDTSLRQLALHIVNLAHRQSARSSIGRAARPVAAAAGRTGMIQPRHHFACAAGAGDPAEISCAPSFSFSRCHRPSGRRSHWPLLPLPATLVVTTSLSCRRPPGCCHRR